MNIDRRRLGRFLSRVFLGASLVLANHGLWVDAASILIVSAVFWDLCEP